MRQGFGMTGALLFFGVREVLAGRRQGRGGLVKEAIRAW
jgi:hypothetical protein